jgi:hypothetical protein
MIEFLDHEATILSVLSLFRLFLLLSALTLSATPCRANLGETLDQSIARYGQPSPPKGYASPNSVGGVSYTFQQNGYAISALFVKDIVPVEFITKKSNSALSNKEMQTVLRAEGGKWTVPEVRHGASWVREDGASASYEPPGNAMLLFIKK